MNNLRQIIKEEIARRGIISFQRFMELALYCPNFGYYERGDESPGKQGDFYTSVSVGSLFGELLAAQIAEWLEVLPEPRQIVEAGAHDGQLAGDIWPWLERNRPDLAESLEYWILEPSARRQQVQREKLKKLGAKFRWFDSWSGVRGYQPNGVSGVILSNELLDAMPVHRLAWDAEKREWFRVGAWRCTRMNLFGNECRKWNQNKIPANLPPELLAILPDGFTTELSPAAIEWWSGAASVLSAGKLLTFDYGLEAEEFFAPQRKEGTLRAYHRHRLSENILANPGEQDITAQVNFSGIIAAGEAAGLKTEFFDDQGRFLTGVLETQREKKISAFNDWTPARARQFQTLTHPAHLGRLFQVIAQNR